MRPRLYIDARTVLTVPSDCITSAVGTQAFVFPVPRTCVLMSGVSSSTFRTSSRPRPKKHRALVFKRSTSDDSLMTTPNLFRNSITLDELRQHERFLALPPVEHCAIVSPPTFRRVSASLTQLFKNINLHTFRQHTGDFQREKRQRVMLRGVATYAACASLP
jgi:hypothetical protein